MPQRIAFRSSVWNGPLPHEAVHSGALCYFVNGL
jgi:hypothetical protein